MAIPSPEGSTLRQRDCHPRIKCGVAMRLWMELGARERGRPCIGGSGRLCWGAVGERKWVGGATPEAIDGVAGMGRVVGETKEGPQLTDVFHGRERRRGPGASVEALDDIPRPGRATVSVDGAFDIGDQMTHAAVQARQGAPARCGIEGGQPGVGDGVHLTEGPDVSIGKTAVADHAVEGGHEPAAGGMGATPVDCGRGHGMTGGAAQVNNPKVGPAE